MNSKTSDIQYWPAVIVGFLFNLACQLILTIEMENNIWIENNLRR